VPASVKCGSQPSTTVAITYSVTGSRSQQVVVDGLPEPGPLAASGRVVERVHCDGVEHTVALIATDAAGRRTSEVKYLATVLPGG